MDRQLDLQKNCSFISSFPVLILLISFSCHSALANTFNMVLDISSERKHFCFIPNLEEDASNGLLQKYDVYYTLWWLHFTPGFPRVLKF